MRRINGPSYGRATTSSARPWENAAGSPRGAAEITRAPRADTEQAV
jgi:hypothetical protein